MKSLVRVLERGYLHDFPFPSINQLTKNEKHGSYKMCNVSGVIHKSIVTLHSNS